MNPKQLEKIYENHIAVQNPDAIFKEMKDIKNWRKEVFVVFCLSTRNHIISREIIGIGILNSVIVAPREIFRTAILRNANAIVCAHNHPGGTSSPSEEDKKVTRQIALAGEIIGIKLLDHVIVCQNEYFSFSTNGLL